MKKQVKASVMETMLNGFGKGIDVMLDMSGDANLLFSGAKARYVGGGWWSITGYSNHDVVDVVSMLN